MNPARPKRLKAKFTINEVEAEQLREKEEELTNRQDGFFSFKWLKEDKGIPYDWARQAEDGEFDKVTSADANEQALKHARQQLYERFSIPKLDEDVFELRALLDKMQARIYLLNSDADKNLREEFQLCDIGNKGYLTKEQFTGFFRLFIANNLQLKVSTKLAEQMFNAVDERKDGMIQFDEIFGSRSGASQVGKASGLIDVSDVTGGSSEISYTNECTERFLSRLEDSLEIQVQQLEDFESNFDKDSPKEDDLVQSVFSTLVKSGWYKQLEQQQKFLLRYIVLKAIEDSGCQNESLPMSLKQFLQTHDMSVALLIILAIGTYFFQFTLVQEGLMQGPIIQLRELVQSARHQRFISMISSGLNQAEEDTFSSLSKSLAKLFSSATTVQKSMMLMITDSFAERQNWLKSVQIKELVAIIGTCSGTTEFDYELLQTYTDEQQMEINGMMSHAMKERYTLWQNIKLLRFSNKGFADFGKPEDEISRMVEFPRFFEIYNQILVPDTLGMFMQIEHHNHNAQFTFQKDEEGSGVIHRKISLGWYLCYSRYNLVTDRLEKTHSIPIEEPIAFKQGTFDEHQKLYFYFGTNKEVFYFTKQSSSAGTKTLNVVRQGETHPQQYEIATNTALSQYLDIVDPSVDTDQPKSLITNSEVQYSPRLIRGNYIVFTNHAKRNWFEGSYQALLFYDIELGQEILKVKGAYFLLHDFQGQDQSPGTCCIFGFNSPNSKRQCQHPYSSEQIEARQLVKYKALSIDLDYHRNASDQKGSILDLQQVKEEIQVEGAVQQTTAKELFGSQFTSLMQVRCPQGKELTIIKRQFTDKNSLQILRFENEEGVVRIKNEGIVEDKIGIAIVHDSESRAVKMIKSQQSKDVQRLFVTYFATEGQIFAQVYLKTSQSPQRVLWALQIGNQVLLGLSESKYLNYSMSIQVPQVNNESFTAQDIQVRTRHSFLTQDRNRKEEQSENDIIVEGHESRRDDKQRWKYHVDYPLGAFVDLERPQELMIQHLAKNAPRYMLHLIGQTSQTSQLRFVCFAKTDELSFESVISFIAADTQNKDLYLYSISLKKAFIRLSVVRSSQWTHSVTKLGEYTQDLQRQLDEVQEVYFYRQKQFKNVAIVYQTQAAIKLLQENQQATDIVRNTDDILMSQIRIVQSICGTVYFVQEDKHAHSSSIVELQISLSDESRGWVWKTREVYSTSTGKIVLLQLNRSEQQVQTKNLLFNGELENSQSVFGGTELYVVGTDLSMTKIKQTKLGPYLVMLQWNLTHIKDFSKAIEQVQPFETMTISERTLVFRDKVFSVGSGNHFEALQSKVKENKIVLQSQAIQHSDKIIYMAQSEYSMSFMFKNDPGRRDSSLVGYRILSLVLSANMINHDTMLFQVLCDFQPNNGKVETYWALVTLDEKVQDLPESLQQALSQDQTQTESLRMGASKQVEVCVQRGINQLMIFQSNKTFKRPNDAAQSPGRFSFSESFLQVCDLAQNTKLLSRRQIFLRQPKSMIQDLVLQNCRGDLVHIFCLEPTMDMKLSKPKYYGKMQERSDKGDVKESLQQVEFSLDMQDCEFVYTGDYLCWKLHQKSFIHLINISELQQTALLNHSLSLGADQTIQEMDDIKVIDLRDQVQHGKEHLITIEPCSVSQTMKQSQYCNLDCSTLNRLENFLQVTLENRVIIYDLLSAEPTPHIDLEAVDQLLDPQLFVEPGVQLTVVRECHSQVRENKEYEIFFGGDKYGLQTSLSAANAGNILIMRRKSCLSVSRTFEHDIMHRTVLGIFHQHAEIDILEIRTLTEQAKSGLKPKNLDLQACLASFGNQTFFTVMKDNLRVLDGVKTQTEAEKYQETEDLDLLPTYNPFLRRLAFALLQKISCEISKDGLIKLQSILQQNLQNTETRDALVKIGRVSPSFSLLKALSCQQDFKNLFSNSSPAVINELNECFHETKSTRQVTQIEWPRTSDLMTLRSSGAVISRPMLEQALEEIDEKITRRVKVRTANLDWLYSDRQNFVSFCTMLENSPSQLYSSELVECMLDQYWDHCQWFIITHQAIPAMIYAMVAIYFMQYALVEPDNQSEFDVTTFVICGSVTLLLWFLYFINEIMKFNGTDRKLDYLNSTWNWINIIALSFVFLISVTQMGTLLNTLEDTYILGQCFSFAVDMIDVESLRIMAAIASFCILAKVFDWLRLFEQTAFYVMLVTETQRDIRAFIILLFTSLMLFGVPLEMLNLNRSEQAKIIVPSFDSWFVNLFLNQYLLALGEFNHHNFANQPQAVLCYFLFLSATFFVQITMLNMLIAIMGDTFERVIENREVNATRIKLNFMNDMAGTVGKRDSIQEDKVFFFVVKPEENEMLEADEWEGTINKVTTTIQRNIEIMGQEMNKKMEKLHITQEDFIRAQQVSDRQMKSYIRQSEQQLNSRMDEMRQDLESKLDRVLTAIKTVAVSAKEEQ